MECLHEFIWKDEVDSTMDEAKRMLPRTEPFAVAAGVQTKGRGTRGRTWTDGDGNAKVTIALPAIHLAPLTLLPLRIGTLVHGVLAPYVKDQKLTLKWPNDILLDQKKLAGTLIEMDNDVLLVGIGVNLKTAPEVPSDGPETGRPSIGLGAVDPKLLSQQLADAVFRWAATDDSGASVVADWSSLTDWSSTLKLRDDGSDVRPLSLLDDGRLRVAPRDGPERILVAEYLL